MPSRNNGCVLAAQRTAFALRHCCATQIRYRGIANSSIGVWRVRTGVTGQTIDRLVPHFARKVCRRSSGADDGRFIATMSALSSPNARRIKAYRRTTTQVHGRARDHTQQLTCVRSGGPLHCTRRHGIASGACRGGRAPPLPGRSVRGMASSSPRVHREHRHSIARPLHRSNVPSRQAQRVPDHLRRKHYV